MRTLTGEMATIILKFILPKREMLQAWVSIQANVCFVLIKYLFRSFVDLPRVGDMNVIGTILDVYSTVIYLLSIGKTKC